MLYSCPVVVFLFSASPLGERKVGMGSQRFSAVFLVLSLFIQKICEHRNLSNCFGPGRHTCRVVENSDAHIDVFLNAGSFYKH